MKLLFICTGNTCRSPMAEALAKVILGPEFDIGSAGMSAWEGAPASDHAIKVMEDRGIDLASHCARQVTEELLREADWVIPMTEGHEIRLCAQYPEYVKKIRRLGNWGLSGQDILDPYGGSLQIYQSSADEIEKMIYDLKNELDNLA